MSNKYENMSDEDLRSLLMEKKSESSRYDILQMTEKIKINSLKI